MSQVWGGFDYGELRRRLEVSLDTGIVAVATATTLTDLTKSWGDNIWAGMFVEITAGAGAGQFRRIISNTANTLVVSPAWAAIPAIGDSYRIYNPTATVTVSGDITIASGTGPVLARISGETVSLPPTQAVKISGETVLARISGETVQTATAPPTTFRARGILFAQDISGGVQLGSGPTVSVTIRNIGGDIGVSGHLWVGGASVGEQPYSGFGVLLKKDETLSVDIDNFNKIRVFATVSGVGVNYFGVY
jgi:hypothetical protein